MINKDPKHEHTYDAQGKMMCCSLEEKINKLADRPLKKKVKKESCCGDDDKPKIAVALEYTPGEQAPKILATGRGYIAESIIEKAGEADVLVYADSKLADTLSKLEIGEMIPPELYTVVAEILVFVDECDKIKGKVGE